MLITLPPFASEIFLSAENQACGLEARALLGKSISGQRNPLGDPPVLPQDEAGPSGGQLGPMHRNTPVLTERNGCPPGLRNEACLMVFACNALASGPGNA